MSIRCPRRLTLAVAFLLAAVLPLALSTVASADPPEASAPSAQTVEAAPLTVPALTDWTPTSGSFELDRHSRVLVGDAAVVDDATTFIRDLEAMLGVKLPLARSAKSPKEGDIVLRLDPGRTELAAEGYKLSVGESIRITGRTPAGVFYGTRTVLQMLRAGTTVPAGQVVDVPNYAQRGVGVCACHIHVSTAWLERLIKDAAYLKLNQLWLELKVKSKAHTEANEWGYYTPEQISRLQRLAARYHVTLVPEVNSPGHIEPWIRNRPDLQLTDVDGNKQVSRLDITEPEAFEFLTSIIDEYFAVFDTPYWHMGADEYMLGSDYSRYPQILAYAREKFGPDAVPEDAFVDFINRMNAYVKSKGKTLRIWNDGITTRATVPLDRDIVVEHWLGDGVKPSQLLAQGHRVMNAAYSLYNVRGGFEMDTEALYSQAWTPLHFEGETVTDRTGVVGAKITMWPDNGSANTENEIEDEVRMPLRFIAQATWGESTPDPTYDAFTARADAVGRAPGFDNVDRTQVKPGRYELAVGERYLTGNRTTDGARVVLGAQATAFRLTTTPDGYYVLKDPETGRCLEARRGFRYLNTPLEPLAPITLEGCSASNRLQRWQLSADDGVRLTNAVTRMVAVINGSGLVQQIPDGHRAQVFTLVGAFEVRAEVSRRTVGPGEATPLTVTVTNGTDAPVTDVNVQVTGDAGWVLDPVEQARDSVAPGDSWEATFTATWTGEEARDTQGFASTVTYTSGGTQKTTDASVLWSHPPVIPGNLAEAQPATQSSTAWGGTADRAVDGNTSGSWGSGSITHTQENVDQPWWQVDLGQQEWIGSVELFNRTDCCSGRLTDPVILLSDTPLPDDLEDALATPGVVSARVDGTVGASVRVPISGHKRYVRVQLPDTGTLALAEAVVRAPQ